jgi:hypothetical protein
MNLDLPLLQNRKTGRCSSWDKTGRNTDSWLIPPHEHAVLADIHGPAQITHIWMTQQAHYRECLLKITYDNADFPSVLVPLGDFFCLGHSMVNSFESSLFSASTFFPYQFNKPCALNCYAPMPFSERAVVELVNDSDEPHLAYFYVDYESLPEWPQGMGYFHAEFRRSNPFGGWGPEIVVNSPEANVVNQGIMAYENNYVIFETQGRGHYIGCNLSVTSFNGTWWGEGDDMIWVDGYKWPPDLHGTGSEDYLGHAGGMQEQAFLRNGSSLFEGHTIPTPEINLWRGNSGYQSSYAFHLENPISFESEIKVTIEHGHANHLANEMSSTAYWYAEKPCPAVAVPPVTKRLPVLRNNAGQWIKDPVRETAGKTIAISEEMREVKKKAAKGQEQSE